MIQRYLKLAWDASNEASERARPAYRWFLVLLGILAFVAILAVVIWLGPLIGDMLGVPFFGGAPLNADPNVLWMAAILLGIFLTATTLSFPLAWAFGAAILRVVGLFSSREAFEFAVYGRLPERCLFPPASNNALERP